MDDQDPGLGLPKTSPPSLADRPSVVYQIPKQFVSRGFTMAGFADEDRTFAIVEISPAQQDRAAKIADGNASVLGRELMFSSIVRVGSWAGSKRERLTAWWDAIGPRGRKLVEAAFIALQSVEEADIETFLASGKVE